MKVLTIMQPWATLIAEGYKEYELRSWNTKYRGEILIYASNYVDKKYLQYFENLNIKEYPSGKIIARGVLTETIKIDKALKDYLIEKDEQIYGHIASRTGYAFKFEEIQKFDEPLVAEIKGQSGLGLWNYEEE